MAVIISAPSGWGKSEHKLELMNLFNCKSVIDNWSGKGLNAVDVASDCLVLTNAEIDDSMLIALEADGHKVYRPVISMGPFVKNIIAARVPQAGPRDTPPAPGRQVSGDHYAKMKIQPWTVMRSFMTREEYTAYHIGTVFGYLMRHKAKGGEVDIHKAAHHMQELSEYLNGESK